MNDREKYYATCGTPKHTPRRITKARKKRAHAMTVAEVREYVFARERNLCRCCRKRSAESMHEIVFRSQLGKVSKQNSVAVCGDGVRGCHGLLQKHQVEVYGVGYDRPHAERTLIFRPASLTAQEWLDVKHGQEISSPVMVEMELAE